ncbi:hypothetical protein DACRYDRAFT_119198 [Dacryopinax primogenitus]|uniref:Actin cytoskeleton-regulatory complex protein SLA1 n=1 Tax=Dacryopinax primogenitus (strain DJM 731) TaxID=1858805 RepID=M5FRC2_DACPD|nr:uncharacterized protein DACRYDRAFT_119198 [Dacryopinax primogenitus]EJT97499.1 hypothetical protein DACRYDRAFT_119198 [Dacryopinax primogenitus]
MSPLALGVIKALYDYEAQSDDELTVKEDDILYLLDNSDSEWWKVRHKTDSSDDEGPSGVVPATYVEEVQPVGIVKALYDYEANANGELSIKEGDVLIMYEKEDDWILVKGDQRDSKVGFVPATYVEDHNPDEAPSTEPTPAPEMPASNYVDPQERVLASVAKASPSDNIETWPVTEIDSKGKKKKGTLGIGKGNVFFASESDKTPVQQWKAGDITSVIEDKPKHVMLIIGGVNAAELHFNAGSKEIAQAIVTKAATSGGALQSGSSNIHPPKPEDEAEPFEDYAVEEGKPKKNGVHWAPSPTSPVGVSFPTPDPTEGESAIATYDFEAQSEDELTVREGDALVVVDRVSSEDWWKCRNDRGQEGVVPRSYVELEAREGAARAAAEAEEAEERARQEEAAQAQAEAESEAEAAAAVARAARERELADEQRRQAAALKRREDEKKLIEQRRIKEEDRARRKAEEARVIKAAEARRAEEASRAQTSTRRRDDGRPRSKSGQSERSKPTNTRIWHDRTGQFKVEAEFLGHNNGKIKLHKINGVIIEVPAEKMSEEDMAYISDIMNPRRKVSIRADSDDNIPLATIADQRKQPEPKDRRASIAKQGSMSKKPTVDWFEFFLNAGCDIDDCTRYANAFERDKIDQSILGDIKPETMRALGLREGDIIRVAKAIEEHRFSPKPPTATKDTAGAEDQMRRDEEYARQLQAEINGNRRSSPSATSPPNLFTGPGGALKTSQRRGRPQTKTSAPLAVDVSSIASASDRLTQSPAAASPSLIPSASPPAPAPAPKAARPLTPAQSGFDDNAWEPRPLTKPAPEAPAAPMIALSLPPQVPVPPTPPASAPSAPPPPPPAPTVTQTLAGGQIARPQTSSAALTPTQTGEFELLAKLSQMRPPSAPVSQMTPIPFTGTPPYQAGLGMGASPIPLAQLQAQQTGMYFQNNGPRGPLVPVPANQGLLNPLVPTNTGFAGFIPTRPTSTPIMQPPALMSQPTGFPSMAGGIRPQPTGFPTFTAGTLPITGLQPQPTGFSPVFAQVPQQQFTTSVTPNQFIPAPAPLPPSQPAANHSPASVFASMKSGSFAAGASDAQPADKYGALRSPNGGVGQPYQGFLTAQPTGFVPNSGTWTVPTNTSGYGQPGFAGYQPR